MHKLTHGLPIIYCCLFWSCAFVIFISEFEKNSFSCLTDLGFLLLFIGSVIFGSIFFMLYLITISRNKSNVPSYLIYYGDFKVLDIGQELRLRKSSNQDEVYFEAYKKLFEFFQENNLLRVTVKNKIRKFTKNTIIMRSNLTDAGYFLFEHGYVKNWLSSLTSSNIQEPDYSILKSGLEKAKYIC